ncbi:MAG: hypothetical protein R2939_00735 [Kofleriaceae bacterium]
MYMNLTSSSSFGWLVGGLLAATASACGGASPAPAQPSAPPATACPSAEALLAETQASPSATGATCELDDLDDLDGDGRPDLVIDCDLGKDHLWRVLRADAGGCPHDLGTFMGVAMDIDRSGSGPYPPLSTHEGNHAGAVLYSHYHYDAAADQYVLTSEDSIPVEEIDGE